MQITFLTPIDLEKFAHLFPDYLLDELPADALLLGCIEEDPPTAAGILMAHIEEMEVIVDWLYVDEPFRRKGGARAMLEILIEEADAYGELDGVSIAFSEEHENMAEFLRSCDFMVVHKEGCKGFVTRLGSFPRFPAPGPQKGDIVPIGEIPEKESARFAGILDNAVIPGIAVPTPFSPSDYRPESCACLEDGKVRALCLLKGDEEGLSIPWVYNNCSTNASFIATVNESMKLLKEKFPADTRLSMASVNVGIEEIIEKYVPVLERSEIYYGTYPFGL